jgi:hypothetical protein
MICLSLSLSFRFNSFKKCLNLSPNLPFQIKFYCSGSMCGKIHIYALTILKLYLQVNTFFLLMDVKLGNFSPTPKHTTQMFYSSAIYFIVLYNIFVASSH